jgi:glycosyltransferase involved in cell wall biosynthesis
LPASPGKDAGAGDAGNGRPLVTVVIPAFNAEAFISEAIESVLAQDYGRVEVIVVDDGSTDRTAAVASRYAVKILTQENRGQAAARNAGVAATGGTFVSFLDADDLWMPSKLSIEVAHLLAHPELDYVLVRMQRSLLPGAPWPPGRPAGWFDTAGPGTLPSAGLVRRAVLERIGPFDSRFCHGSDTEWQARAVDAGVRWELLPEVLVQYRVHGANNSYDNVGMKGELFELLRASLGRKRIAR